MSYLPNLLYLLSLFSSSFREKRFGALSFASGTTLSRYVWQHFLVTRSDFYFSINRSFSCSLLSHLSLLSRFDATA